MNRDREVVRKGGVKVEINKVLVRDVNEQDLN